MDLISPLFPHAFVTLLCLGSLARSVSKYSLSSYALKITSTALLDIVSECLECVYHGEQLHSQTWFSECLECVLPWVAVHCQTWFSESLECVLPWVAAGVASGATRAALTQHFALRKNAADVSAKVMLQQLPVLPVGKMY